MAKGDRGGGATAYYNTVHSWYIMMSRALHKLSKRYGVCNNCGRSLRVLSCIVND